MSKEVFALLRIITSLSPSQVADNHPARGRFQGDSYSHCVTMSEHLSPF